MNIKNITVEINEKELQMFVFALKRQLMEVLNNHIKNLQDTYKEGNSFRRRIFFEQNEEYLDMFLQILRDFKNEKM